MSINLPLVTNRVSTWAALKGKPYITVSARGISNGKSTIINDGADFGPDTMLGATSKDQYGPPYTQTTGIQEAWNYAFASATTNYPNQNNIKPGAYWMKPILLLDGLFIVNQKVFLSPAVPIANPKMIGSGMMSTYIFWDFNDNCIEIDHTNGNIISSNIEIGYMQPQAGSNVGAGTAFFAANYVSGDPSYQHNTFQSYDMDFADAFSGNAMFSLTGFQKIILYNPQTYAGGVYGALYTENTDYVSVLGGFMYGNPYNFYANNVQSIVIYGTHNAGSAGVLSNVEYLYIDHHNLYVPFQINGPVQYMHIAELNSGYTVNLLNTQGSSSVSIQKLKIDYLNVYNASLTLSASNLITINDIETDTFNVASGAAIYGQWVNSPTTPTVPASGTAVTNTNLYPVLVYVNGGAITNITRKTITGTSYTVYSNSTASAVYIPVRLENGDSITITYTTAPTWTWVNA